MPVTFEHHDARYRPEERSFFDRMAMLKGERLLDQACDALYEGWPGKALPLLEAAIGSGHAPDAGFLKSLILLARGENEDAKRVLQAAFDSGGSTLGMDLKQYLPGLKMRMNFFGPYHGLLPANMAGAAMLLARLHLSDGDAEAAIGVLRRAIAEAKHGRRRLIMLAMFGELVNQLDQQELLLHGYSPGSVKIARPLIGAFCLRIGDALLRQNLPDKAIPYLMRSVRDPDMQPFPGEVDRATIMLLDAAVEASCLETLEQAIPMAEAREALAGENVLKKARANVRLLQRELAENVTQGKKSAAFPEFDMSGGFLETDTDNRMEEELEEKPVGVDDSRAMFLEIPGVELELHEHGSFEESVAETAEVSGRWDIDFYFPEEIVLDISLSGMGEGFPGDIILVPSHPVRLLKKKLKRSSAIMRTALIVAIPVVIVIAIVVARSF